MEVKLCKDCKFYTKATWFRSIGVDRCNNPEFYTPDYIRGKINLVELPSCKSLRKPVAILKDEALCGSEGYGFKHKSEKESKIREVIQQLDRGV
jgi:hypothetical protein